MEITIQEAHMYLELVRKGLASNKIFHGFDEYPLIVTGLDDNDNVYFKDLASGTVCHPGVNMIESIKSVIDKEFTNQLP